MALIEQGVCRIEEINNHGLGTSLTAHNLVAIPYVTVGELVHFERHAYRGKSNCLLKGIVEESANRITPECKYFGSCGGCLLQHMSTSSYALFKLSLIENALKVAAIETNIAPLVIIPKGQRRRVNIEAIKKEEKIYLGFHRFQSQQIVNIDSCAAMMPELSNILSPLKTALGYVLSHKQKAQIFCTKASNGIDILLELQNQTYLTAEQKSYLSNFASTYGVIRLQFRHRKFFDVVYKSDEPYIVLGNVKVATDASCFLQASAAADQILAATVQKYLPNNGSRNIADLFCGRGTFALPLSQYFNVDGYESDKTALNALAKASEKIILQQRDLFTAPLKAKELNKYDYIVLNPPRAGAEEQCLEIAASKCQRIVYISCNPESFTRDAKILCDNGRYKLLEITPIDQFYWSPHLEVVGVFAK